MMGLISKKYYKEKEKSSEPYFPFVSIVISAFNEENEIERRLENLTSLNYPQDRYEIIIVDDNSRDKTVELVHKFLKTHHSHPEIKFKKKKERNGKANSLNLAVDELKGDLISSSDVNSVFDKEILLELTKHFKDQNVGAVCGSYNVVNDDEASPNSEKFYWNLEDLMLKGESALDSVGTIIGSASMWRKEFFNFNEKIISEDLDLMVRIRKQGYQVKYEPNAKVYELAPTNVTDIITQRCRTSIGTIQCIFKYPSQFFLLNKKHSFFMFSHKVLRMFSPFNLIITAVLFFLLPLNSMIIFLISFGIVSVALLLLLIKLVRSEYQSENSLSILNLIKYVLVNEYLILVAWKRFSLGETSTKWDKAESTRAGK